MTWAGLFLANFAGAQQITRKVMTPGGEREYLLHVPATVDPEKPTPLLVALHPFATTAAMMVRLSGLSETADKHGFAVVYPEGTGIPALRNWNSGSLKMNPVDDVGFIKTVLDDVSSVLNVDKKRVYATGMSNGAMMCHRLGAELSDQIAAIAPVAGTLGFEEVKLKRPVSVLHFHGTNDQFVPFEGPNGDTPQFLKFLSVEATMRAWAKANGCGEQVQEEAVPDKAQDGAKVTLKRYGMCQEGAEVLLYKIEAGGHTWPGAKEGPFFLGKTTQDIDANELMWQFFERHPMP